MMLNELGRQNFIRRTNSDSRLLRKYFGQLSIFKSGDLNFCVQGTPSWGGCSGYCSTPEKTDVISTSHLQLHLTASHADKRCVSYFNSTTAEVDSEAINSEDELLVQVGQLQTLPLALVAEPDSNHQSSRAAWFAWSPSPVPCACWDMQQMMNSRQDHLITSYDK